MAGDEPEADLRVFPPELFHRGKQDVIPQGMGAADKELFFGHPFHHQRLFALPFQLDDPLGVREEMFARGGELDVPAGPSEQRFSQGFLQHLNAGGDRGLDEMERLLG